MTNPKSANVSVRGKTRMIGWIALVATLGIFLAIAMMIDDWSRDWTHNFAELRSDAKQKELRPVTLNQTTQEAFDHLVNWVGTQSRWGPRVKDASGELRCGRRHCRAASDTHDAGFPIRRRYSRAADRES